MKKYTTTIFCFFIWCFITNVAQAQITYTQASFPQAGDTMVITRATDSTLSITAASSSATAWDFSTLLAISTSIDTIQPASSGADFSKFPTTDILQPLLPGLGGIAYVDVNTTQMVRIGGGVEIFGLSFVTAYSDQHITQIVPLTYPNTASDTYKWKYSEHIDSVPFLRALLDSVAGSVTSNTDSIRMTLNGREVREVDAFGTCMMSDSTYDVLRQKVLNIITLKAEVYATAFGFGTWVDITSTLNGSLPIALPNNDTTIYYDYLVEGLKQPLVHLQLDRTNSFVVNIQYLQGDTTTIGVQYIADELDVNIFPNPTTSIINIATNDLPENGYHLHIVDMTGRIVLQKNNIREENYQLPVAHLPNGHYVVVMRNKEYKIIKRQQIDILK